MRKKKKTGKSNSTKKTIYEDQEEAMEGRKGNKRKYGGENMKRRRILKS